MDVYSFGFSVATSTVTATLIGKSPYGWFIRGIIRCISVTMLFTLVVVVVFVQELLVLGHPLIK